MFASYVYFLREPVRRSFNTTAAWSYRLLLGVNVPAARRRTRMAAQAARSLLPAASARRWPVLITFAAGRPSVV